MLGVKLARAVIGPAADHQGLARLPRLLRRPRGGARRARARCPAASRSRGSGELDSYADALERNAGEVAAIIVEPVQYTGVVTPRPTGFLPALRELARDAGVLFVLDDCLMFRLAEGGSAERFGIDADITCLGQVDRRRSSGRRDRRRRRADVRLRPARPSGRIYHGGSFNGNLLGSRRRARSPSRDLTAQQIERIDGLADRMRAAIEYAAARRRAAACAHPGSARRSGSTCSTSRTARSTGTASALLHLAAVTHGVYYGSGGEFGLCDGDRRRDRPSARSTGLRARDRRSCAAAGASTAWSRWSADATDAVKVTCDVGGTFTDVVVSDAAAHVHIGKSLTTPHDLIAGLLSALERAADGARARPRRRCSTAPRCSCTPRRRRRTRSSRATTARTALLCTEGFPGHPRPPRGRLDASVRLQPRLPGAVHPAAPDVRDPRADRRRRRGRHAARRRPGARRAGARSAALDVEAVAIALLWSVANGEHEDRLRDRCATSCCRASR